MSRPAAPTADPYDLARFVAAQAPVLDRVEAELRAGSKTSHWMWFVFPQIAGLGRSATARRYALPSLGAAGAYLAHPLLGPRLLACTGLVLGHPDRDAHDIFGTIDAMKFRSSMTLFAAVPGADPAFDKALRTFFDGVRDPETLNRIR